ncbi:MAG: TetR/AcrR family transcriptional regulator [Acidobacteria bacterium]|nr:MAG: TetR/AcrR family transcriptional regulator [Acidobacteriota bacterium]MCE7959445.1 TetR/AcrR family transcriptional regulator [Acidobacteria bacterium ACB2]
MITVPRCYLSGGMGRKKTVPDDDVLAIARGLFASRGYSASTREIARVAGLSEAVLYQRFGTKDGLFLAAMTPRPADIEEIFGPVEPEGDPRRWLRGVVERMSAYFAEIVPLAIQLILHPVPDSSGRDASESVSVTGRFEDELAHRLRRLRGRGDVSAAPERPVARLLVSLAHDRALRSFLSRGDPEADRKLLGAMVDAAWKGLAPGPGARPARGSRGPGA